MRRVLVGVLAAAAILLPTATATAAPPVSAFAATPGTAWWTDGRLTVSIDDSVRPAVAAGLTRAVTRAGGTVLREPGTLRPHIAGGDTFNAGAVGGRCLIRTTVCSEPGESGGPLFAGTVGIGMNWGGSGNCATGGTSYYSSVRRAATAYGVAPY